MKKVIDGKVYNTSTAQEMARWSNIMNDVRSFHYFCEVLYRKKTGEFFLHGKGNAASRYAESVGQNTWSSGERIIPLDLDAAKKWCSEHLDGDDYERIFGAVSEDAEDVLLTFKAPAALDRKLSDKATALGISKSQLLRQLIEKM